VNARPFLVYAVVVSLLEEAALVGFLLLVLPRVGLIVPIWGVIVAVLVMAATSAVLTWLNLKALVLKPARSPDVGVRGRVVKALAPRGYVRVGNELWSAECGNGTVAVGERVIVTRMDGFRLVVEPVKDDL
jgi:membrane protein implicated in regulation of membrane protease activity